MKNALSTITLILLLVNTAYSQVYEDSLEEIYINSGLYEEVDRDDFRSLNENLLEMADFNIREALRESKRKNELVIFRSNLNEIRLSRREYLTILRKAANRSSNDTEFVNYLLKALPELSNRIRNYRSNSSLYRIVRKDTFNGRLEALPTLL
ncbi:MAG: hypothetical protein WBA16_07765 [Nonlabens sp.]